MTDPEGDAIARVTAACVAARDARTVWHEAVTERERTVVGLWPTLARFGPKWLSAHVGEGVITWPNLKKITEDLHPRPSRGPFTGPPPDVTEHAALMVLRAVCTDAADAKTAASQAVAARDATMREEWPNLSRLKLAELRRRIGADLVADSTIRYAIAELRRQ